MGTLPGNAWAPNWLASRRRKVPQRRYSLSTSVPAIGEKGEVRAHRAAGNSSRQGKPQREQGQTAARGAHLDEDAAGRLLEGAGDCAPRGMTTGRTRVRRTEPGLQDGDR